MKTIRIVLLLLIVLGVGLLITQKFWIPPLVALIMETEGAPQALEVPDVPDPVPKDGMEEWNWVLSEVSPQGTQFEYPDPLPTRFVSAQSWPPLVQMVANEFSCVEGDVRAADGPLKRLERRVINGHVYCVSLSSEGAAGSTYTSYEYATQQGDFVVRVVFTLRTPQCLNYDEPEQSACKTEQSSFNTDALADRIASSLRMQ